VRDDAAVGFSGKGKGVKRSARILVVGASTMAIITAACLIVTFTRREPPWTVLRTCRVSRVQLFDSSGHIQSDTESSGPVQKAEMCERATKIVRDAAYYYYSSRSPTTARQVVGEPLSVIVESVTDGRTYRLLIESGGSCVLQADGDRIVWQFPTHRDGHLFDALQKTMEPKRTE